MFLNLTDLLDAALSRHIARGEAPHWGLEARLCWERGGCSELCTARFVPLFGCCTAVKSNLDLWSGSSAQNTQRWIRVFLQLFGIVYVFCSLCLTVQTGIVTRKGKKTPLNAKVCVGEIGTGVTTELGLEASSAEHTKSSESFTYGSKITNTRLEKVTWIEKLWTCSSSLLASCQFSPFNVYIMCALTLQGCGYFPPTDSWKRIFLQ